MRTYKIQNPSGFGFCMLFSWRSCAQEGKRPRMVSADREIAAATSEKTITTPHSDRQPTARPGRWAASTPKLVMIKASSASRMIHSPITKAQRTGGEGTAGRLMLEQRV